MAWCLNFHTDFGRFFPVGHYVQWKESLQVHFSQSLSEDERASFENRFAVYFATIIRKLTSNADDILENEWPSEYQLERNYKQLGSILVGGQGLLFVTADVKIIVENLEPNVHQFRPIRIIDKSGEVVDGNYHVLAIKQYLDIFDPEASDDGSVKWGETFKRYRIKNLSDLSGVAIYNDVVSGKHLWRGLGPMASCTCFSTTLVDALQAHDLLLPKLLPTKGTPV